MSGVKVNNGVINYGGMPSAGGGLLANRPAAGVLGRIYIASDIALLYQDNGTDWVTIGNPVTVTGTGAPNQVAYWTNIAGTLSGSNNLFWDSSNNRLGIGTNGPGVRLDVHSTNVIAQFNGTGINNAYLDFQNAGSTQWRIGNQYSGATNNFTIFNAAGSTEVFTISQAGNVAIGNTVPSAGYRLTLNGNSSTNTGGIVIRQSGTDVFYIGNVSATNTTDFELWNPRNGYVRIGANNIEYVRILPGGNIGMNYTNPAAKLSVAGSVLINTNTANALYELFVNGNIYTGGLSPTIATQATSVAMTRTQCGYVCTATLTLTLPAASGLNNFYFVVANTGATVTVQRAGTDTILDKLGVSQTSVIVAAGTRSMFYVGGGSITYQIF